MITIGIIEKDIFILIIINFNYEKKYIVSMKDISYKL